MAERGVNVVLAARNAAALEEVATLCRAAGVTAEVIPTDVTDREACRKLIDRAGHVDILVNNAGFAIFDEVASARADDLRAMMDTNFFGTVHCTQAVLPQMLERRSGAIVNVASIAGLMGFFRMSGYCATKFALVGWTEALRDEVIGRGVKVSLICPGTTDTAFFVKAEKGKMPKASRLILSMSPEHVAKAICAAAEDGRYRRIMPLFAHVFMRMKEWTPRVAHVLMRRVSSILE
jgi:short-subunit dehydrogenase